MFQNKDFTAGLRGMFASKKTLSPKKDNPETFHIVIGEIHMHETPINTVKMLYEKLIAKNPNLKIAVCLETKHLNITKIKEELKFKKDLSDKLEALALQQESYDALSTVTMTELAKYNLQHTPDKTKRSIMLNLFGRKRVLAHEQFLTYSEANNIKIFGVDTNANTTQARSEHMLNQLQELGTNGYCTLSVFGREHLTDIKKLSSTSPRNKLNNFFPCMVLDNIPFKIPNEFDDSLKTAFNTLEDFVSKLVIDSKELDITYHEDTAEITATRIFESVEKILTLTVLSTEHISANKNSSGPSTD